VLGVRAPTHKSVFALCATLLFATEIHLLNRARSVGVSLGAVQGLPIPVVLADNCAVHLDYGGDTLPGEPYDLSLFKPCRADVIIETTTTCCWPGARKPDPAFEIVRIGMPDLRRTNEFVTDSRIGKSRDRIMNLAVGYSFAYAEDRFVIVAIDSESVTLRHLSNNKRITIRRKPGR
jgi:hypothetical protein